MFACLAAMIAATPASASGGLWCDADDASVRLKIESGATRGQGNPLFNFRGELEIKDAAVAADLRGSSFDESNLTQHWTDAHQLNLQLYRQRAEDKELGEINLVIETKSVEEATYEGTYTVDIFDMAGDASDAGKTLSLTGKVSCGAE
jgi:hypothetical protein